MTLFSNNVRRVGEGKIRTAIVGFGVSGQVFHAPLIQADPLYSLDAIVTANPERVARARERYPQAQIIASYSELLALIDAGTLNLDLLILGTPPAGHREQGEAAIARGLHLVIDKPFVPSSAEGEALIQAAQAAGTILTVFQNRRWDSDFLTLKNLLNEGMLGEVRSFESRFEWWLPQGFRNWRDEAAIAEAGGLLFDLGSHLIDQAIQLFGPVSVAYAELTRHNPLTLSNADEESFVSLLHTSGVRSRLWMNGLAARQGPRYHVLGSQAAFTKWGLDVQEPMLAAGVTPEDARYGIEEASRWGLVGSADHSRTVPAERGDYPAFYRQLANALLHGAALPVEPQQSLAALRIIEDLHARYTVRCTNQL